MNIQLVPFGYAIQKMIQQPHYPCVAALAALKRGDIRTGVYSGLGTGHHALQLGDALRAFKKEYESSRSKLLSYMAIFDDSSFKNEEDFEIALWSELSKLSSTESDEVEWDQNFSANPNDQKFCFSFDGSAFFVVGLHPQSSRKARRFEKPTLVFNLYSQFESLDEETEFYPMVQANRKRELDFQGGVNPMVEQWAEIIRKNGSAPSCA